MFIRELERVRSVEPMQFFYGDFSLTLFAEHKGKERYHGPKQADACEPPDVPD
jgi:hypothetical protein